MFKNIKNKLLIILFCISSSISSNAYAIDLVLDLPDIIQNTLSYISEASQEASGKVKEAYQLVTKTEAVKTTINTYKNLLEAVKIFNKTKQLYNIVTGNPGFSSALRVAGDRDVRRALGSDWSDTVDVIGGASSSFLGTDRRIRSAMNSFETINVPYKPDLVYIDPKLFKEKEIYKEKVKKNKTYAVIAQSNIDRAEENVEKIDRMETSNDTVQEPKERDTLRNAIMISQFQAQTEANNALERMNKITVEKNIEETQKRANDVIIANKPLELW